VADQPTPDQVASFIRAAAGRTPADTDRLAAMLREGCWPGGAVDRSEPGAREWLRRWRPASSAPPMFECSCARGRCRVCN